MLNFLIIGDWGRHGTPEQRAVAQAMAQVAKRLRSHFVLTTGDNFYDDGVTSVDDPHWCQSFEDVYTAASLRTAWYATLGNHDYRGNVQAQIDYGNHSARWRLPGRYYALEMTVAGTATVQLVFLDTTPFLQRYHPGGSEVAEGVRDQDTARQLDWLRSTLAASNAPWKLVVGHHPIYSGSPFHGSTIELQHLVLPILQEHSVQAYFCGHEHDLQHLYDNDLHHVLSGAGSEYRATGTCEYSSFSQSTLGFASVSLTAERMQIGFYNAQGRNIYQADIMQPRQTEAASLEV